MGKEADFRELGRHFINAGKKAAEEVAGHIAQNYVTHGSDLRQKVWDGAGALFSGGSTCPLRITKRESDFLLEFEIPGRDLSEIEVVVLDDTVTVRSKKIASAQLESTAVIIVDEFQDAAIDRTVRLPEVVDSTKVSAEMRRGILKVILGRREGKDIPVSEEE